MALSAPKIREYVAGYQQIDMDLPVSANAVIYAGAMLEWATGFVEPLSGAGVFAGFALETVTGGASDGDVTCKVRVQGGVRMNVTTDTTTAGIVGVAATVPEATDDDTLRIETGAAITGTQIGTFAAALAPLGVAGKVEVSFKAGHIA